MKEHELIILQVVERGAGRADTRGLDFEYYARSPVVLEPNLLHLLRGFEQRGLVESVPVDGGTGPGWRLTEEGRRALGAQEPTS